MNEITKPSTARLGLAAGTAAVITASVALIVALFLAGGNWRTPEGGLPDSGALIGWLDPITTLLAFLLGLKVIADWLRVALFSPVQKNGRLSEIQTHLVRRNMWWSLAWSGVAFLSAAVIVTRVLAAPPSGVFDFGLLTLYGWDVPQVRAMLLMSALAIGSAIAARLAHTVTTAGLWAFLSVIALTTPPLFSHGVGVSGHSTAIAAGFLHGAAMAIWLGGLAALLLARDSARVIRHFAPLATIAVIALAASGVMMAWTRLTTPAELFTTGYGQVVLLKAGALVGAAAIAIWARARTNVNDKARLFAIEFALAATAIGAGVALALSPFPREAVLPSTVLEQLTGYPEPPAFSFARAFGGVAIDPATLLVGLLALGLYWTGVLRLSRRGDRWPWQRTLAWTLGVLIGLYVTNSMLGRYALVMLSVHMGVHMALSMFAPIFLVLGAPVTLALRALRPSPDDLRGPREWLLAFLHAPLTRFIANPFVAFVLWVGSAYALYLTGLFTTIMTDPLGHALMNAHFLIIGYLFFWNIIGIDPPPTQIPPVAKLGLLIAAIALHGFFGVIVMGSSVQIGGTWFFDVAPSWLASGSSDQQLAGGVAWAISEIPLLFVLIVLGLQWARGDARKARQKERSGQADDELASYNEMLNKMGAPTNKS